jgi:hypothetical protein
MPRAVSSPILTAQSRIPSNRIPLSFVVHKVALGQVLIAALPFSSRLSFKLRSAIKL